MWTLKKVAGVVKWPCDRMDSVTGFAIDSRKVEEGNVFFALKGERADGHAFLEEVAKAGAVGAVVTKDYRGPDFGLQLIYVEDALEALQALARVAFASRGEQVVAVTGSMGKTTTKEFIATILSERFRVAKTEGNQNTQLTMPLTLLNLKGEYDVFVLEMGMGDHGNLTRLTSIAPPDVAVLTKIAPAGLKDFAGGLEAVARAKSEIFSQKKTRLGILSAQAAGFGSALYGGGCQKWIYGLKKDVADAREVDFVLDASGRINDSPPMEFPFAAEHLKENVVAAAAVARAFGLSWEEIASGVKKCRPFEKRFEMVNRDGVTFVNDSYNANPHSMVAALANLPEPKEGGRRIAVLGPMADLGNSSLHYHKQVGNFAMEKVDALVCVGREAKSYGKAIHVEKNQEAKELLRSMIRPGDVVLVKGSNAGKLWEVLE